MPHYSAVIGTDTGEYVAYVEADTEPEARAKMDALGTVDDFGPHKPRYGQTVIIGHGRWGSGVDLAAAKAEYRRQGGVLSNGYQRVDFDEGTDFVGVDGGVIRYRGNAPEWTTVEPTRRARR